MSRYRRAHHPGGTFFLTLVTYQRRPFLDGDRARRCLRDAIDKTRATRPFDLLQSVLLPDPLHSILRLPADDADFSTRVADLKAHFTRAGCPTGVLACGVCEIVRERIRAGLEADSLLRV